MKKRLLKLIIVMVLLVTTLLICLFISLIFSGTLINMALGSVAGCISVIAGLELFDKVDKLKI